MPEWFTIIVYVLGLAQGAWWHWFWTTYRSPRR
jgi:hypothetical protein